MSIPYIKQRLTERIRTSSAGPAPARQEAPSSQGPRPREAPPAAKLGALVTIIAMLSAFVPSAEAQVSSGLEDFERCDVFDIPDTEDCASNLYSFDSVGTGSTQVVSTPAIGTRSARIVGTTNYAVNFLSAGPDYCTGSGGGIDAHFSINFDALPPATEGFSWGISKDGSFSNAASEAHAYFTIGADGVVSVFAKRFNTGNFQTATFSAISPLIPDTWYEFEITCTNAFNVVFKSITHTESIQLTTTLGDGLDFDIFRVEVGTPATGGTSGRIFVDNIKFEEPLIPGVIFCSNPFENNFGYEFVEDVDYDPDLTGNNFNDLDDAFVFEGSLTNSDYLAKGFSTGGKAVAVNFTLEAATEAASSLFRVAFTLGNNGIPSALNKGDGTDGGNFDNHVGVRLAEEGDEWNIGIYENVGGAGYNRIGSDVNLPGPNGITDFRFEVDSREISGRTATLYANGAVLMQRQISATFTEEIWEDQWFVGTAASLLNNLNVHTYLNDNDEPADSTCIFDLIGGMEQEGSSGSTPHSQIPDIPDDGDQDGNGQGTTGDDIAALLGNVYFWVVFWIVLINVCIAALSWGTRAGFGGLVYGIATLCVYIAAILLNGPEVVNPWPIVAVASVAIGFGITRWIRS